MPPTASATVCTSRPLCPTAVAAGDEKSCTSVSGHLLECQIPPSNREVNALRAKQRVRRRSQRRLTFRRNGVFVPFLISVSLLLLIASIVKVYAVDDDQYADNNNGYFDAADGGDASVNNAYANFYDEYGNKLSYDGMSMMPISCIPLNGGHLIKFQLFENESSYQCHFKVLGTYIVSIAHFMRAYFNYQALIKGKSFTLPSDAAYLNCVLVQSTQYSAEKLYAKIGCLDRNSLTSTKLALHLFLDKQCSMPFEDYGGLVAKNGYIINGEFFSNHISFRPPFYSCVGCMPDQVSSSFKKSRYWYDDDLINVKGITKQFTTDDGNDNTSGNNDDQLSNDDLYNDSLSNSNTTTLTDDLSNYFASFVDDTLASISSGSNASSTNTDDGANETNNNARRLLTPKDDNRRLLAAHPSVIEEYESKFWLEVDQIRRSLTDLSSWNMCQRIFKYGIACGEDCEQIETFHVNEWSTSDVFLVVVMCIFMAGMMLLVFAKRVKAYEKASIYGDEVEPNYPGLPPLVMVLLFITLMAVIITMARLKLVNETLVFSVATCTLLFIYMLKLTLFENRPQLMASLTGRRSKKTHGFDLHRQLYGA